MGSAEPLTTLALIALAVLALAGAAVLGAGVSLAIERLRLQAAESRLRREKRNHQRQIVDAGTPWNTGSPPENTHLAVVIHPSLGVETGYVREGTFASRSGGRFAPVREVMAWIEIPELPLPDGSE